MKNPKNRKLASVCSLFAFCLLLALAGCGGSDEAKQTKAQQSATPVSTAEAEQTEVVYTLEQVGDLEASDRALLRAEVAGSVAEISFQEGSVVQKDEVLVRVDDAKVRAEIRNLQARIEQLQVRLGFQEKTLARNRSLLKKKAIPQHQFDQLATEVEEAKLAISQAQASLARQRDLLTDTVIRAPFAGVVGAKNLSIGDYLKAGDPVVEVVVLDPLEIAFQVPERYKPNLSQGQKVGLRVVSAPDKRFEGDIFFVSPTVDVKTRSFLVKARVANPDHQLNPGMFARVSLITAVHPNAKVVPWDSIIQTETETFLYRVEQGKAHKTVVELGKVTPQWAEVLEPDLKPGEKVILEGKYAVQDGAAVAPKAQQAQSETSDSSK